jgi:hypothetical protein
MESVQSPVVVIGGPKRPDRVLVFFADLEEL